MTIAEQLKSECSLTDEQKEMYKKEALNLIRQWGYYSVYCNNHVGEIRHDRVPLKNEKAFREFMQSEGLKVSEDYNGYGVRHLKVTL